MKGKQTIVYRFVAIVLLILSIALLGNHVSEAHFFGVTKNVGNYQAVLQTFPVIPSPGQNTTLGFSLLDTNGNNVFNVAVSTEIKEGENTIKTFPEKRYEFSDISQTYTFPREGTYKIIYHANIASDNNPVTMDFDIIVSKSVPTDWQTVVITVGIAGVVAAGIVWFRVRKSRNKPGVSMPIDQ